MDRTDSEKEDWKDMLAGDNCNCDQLACDDTCLCNCHRESEIDNATHQVEVRQSLDDVE